MHIVFSVGRLVALLAGLCLLTACPNQNDDPPRITGDREPSTTAVVNPEVLFLAPGESAEVQLSIAGVAGDRTYRLGDEVDRPRTPTDPDDADVRVEIVNFNGFGTGTANVTIGAAVGPGVHHVPVEFENDTEHGTVTRTRDLIITVLPTDQTEVAGRVVEIAAGDTHNLARLEDGSVWAWGRNDFGQLGDGTFIDRQVPVRVEGLTGSALAIAAGGRHSIALMDDGGVWAWGDNDKAQVQWEPGTGTTYQAYVRPTRLVDDGPNGGFFDNPVAVAAGTEHSVLLESAGAVRVWGSNYRGQLGSSNLADFATAERVRLPVTVQAIASGGDHTIVLATDNSLWGWGRSNRGQLGAAVASPYQLGAIDIAFVSGVVGMGLGLNHTLLVLDDGNIGGLGQNLSSQLGDGSLQTPNAQPITPPRLRGVRATDGGWLHSLALQNDASVYAWGSNDFGQASDSANTTTPSNLGRILQLVPERVTAVPRSTAIAAGGRHSLALTELCGSVYSWGDDALGQLGDGAFRTTRARPQPVYGLGQDLPGCREVLGLFSRGGAGTITVATDRGVAIDAADCATPCVTSFDLGTQVTLTARPADGAVFIGWSGNCSGTAPTIQVTMDRGRNCLAWFASRPVAQFTMTPNPLTAPTDSVVLNATDSSDPDGRIVAWEWDVGNDGRIDGSGATLNVQPTIAPPFEVRLVVTDNDGLSAEAVQTLELAAGGGGDGVVADFYYDPLEPFVGQEVHFGAFSSSSPNGEITSYEWDFEDDGIIDATGVMVDRTYDAAGDYTVRLRVSDATGASAETTVTIPVSPG